LHEAGSTRSNSSSIVRLILDVSLRKRRSLPKAVIQGLSVALRDLVKERGHLQVGPNTALFV
jgi:hypothetical protein